MDNDSDKEIKRDGGLICTTTAHTEEKEGPHLSPLSIGLYHQYDAGVRLIECVSIQQSFARHAQLYFADAGSWTAEAGRRGGGLLNIIHPGSGREELRVGGGWFLRGMKDNLAGG